MYCVRNIATYDFSCWLAIYHITHTIVSVQALGGPTLTVQVGIACMYIKIYKFNSFRIILWKIKKREQNAKDIPELLVI